MTQSKLNPKKICILIVEENQNAQKALGLSLKKIGFPNIISVGKCEKGVLLTRKKEIHCILCAYETNGLSFLRIIRNRKHHSEIPFFMTDEAFTNIKVLKAGQAGVTGLLVMPCKLKTLQTKIIQAFGRKKEIVVGNAEKNIDKGSALIKEKRYDEALKVFDTLINQKETPEHYYNIGYIKTMQGKHSEAIVAFRKATQLDRLFAKAYEEMGRAYRALGKSKEADECMNQAAQIYLERDNDAHAEEILNEVLALGTESLNVFNSLGIIYRKKGDHEASLRHYTKALKIHPGECNIYYNIGRIYLDMREIDKARNFFQQAVDIEPDFDAAKQVIKALDLGVL